MGVQQTMRQMRIQSQAEPKGIIRPVTTLAIYTVSF